MNVWKYRFSLAENGLLLCTMKLQKIAKDSVTIDWKGIDQIHTERT